MIHPPIPASSYVPARPHTGLFRQVNIDGDAYDDDLPPELFDEDEDFGDLVAFIHMAEEAIDE